MVKKEYKDYKIHRNKWWRFWQIDRLEFTLYTRYQDAYQEVETKTLKETTYSWELMDWVIKDVREQLEPKVKKSLKLVKKAKSLKVKFRSSELTHHSITTLDFYYIDGYIYFDSDESIKRERILNKLGI